MSEYNENNESISIGITAEGMEISADTTGSKNTIERKKGVFVYNFKEPFEYEGKKYETLAFDFERLTGRDVIAIENEMQANNEYALDPLLSRSFQCRMASRAGNIGNDVLQAMPIHSFNKITGAARNFLAKSSGA